MTKSLPHWLPVCLMATVFLSACSAMPVSIFPTKIDSHFVTSVDVNPDVRGDARPVIVRVYELKSANAFEGADFFTLYDEEAKALGTDLIARYEFELAPGEQRQFQRKPHADTRYMGVLVAYRAIDDARWRATATIEQRKTNRLTVDIGKKSVSINSL